MGPDEEPPEGSKDRGEQTSRLDRLMSVVRIVTLVGVIVFCWLFGFTWLVGYVCWLAGSDQVADRIARPVRYVLQHPPSAGLSAIVLVGLMVLLFFAPLSDFLHNLESGPLGMTRRKRTSRRTQRGQREGR